ncbi:hypothetical protein EXIGLDRAFT_52561 [Exidia glandulosa HHB12029]|uniref:Uncharacterized protein n=1 Tax=Exidia glandulosa HHB12029 TaxID=1314781 RepID=A0A165ICV6_EXIGL|nr:hypothetical protein EXIGLDRAFT_52561 [Exidia glandulosa HHB12029]
MPGYDESTGCSVSHSAHALPESPTSIPVTSASYAETTEPVPSPTTAPSHDKSMAHSSAAAAEAVALMARRLNDAAPIARLPSELFSGIFLAYIPLRQQVRATCVCRIWRTTLLSTPSAWMSLSNYGVACPEGVLTHLLGLSGTLPLHLDLEATSLNWVEVCACLRSCIHRCVSLAVTLNATDGAGALTAVLSEHPAPVLRAFRLYDRSSHFNFDLRNDVFLFAGHAPQLELAKLHTDLSRLRPCESLRKVKRLLCCTTVADRMSLRRFQNILDLFSGIEVLSVDLEDWLPDAEAVSVVMPKSLTDLIIKSCLSNVSPLALLQHIPTAHLLGLRAKMHRSRRSEDAAALAAHIFANTRPNEMSLETLLGGADHMNVYVFWDKTNDQDVECARRLYNVPFSTLRASLTSAFASITRLSLGEGVVTSGALPPVPALTALTVHLFYGMFQKECGEDSIFLLPRHRSDEHLISCPLLKTLEISAAPASDIDTGGLTTWLTPDMIYDFIHFHMSYDAPRLERLVFEGAMLVENYIYETTIARILTLVDDVEWRRGYVLDPSPYDELMNWN